jgi:hypothetical protein
MNIHKIVRGVVDGVKHDFVMIDSEEYNNYMLHVAYSNKNSKMIKLLTRNENITMMELSIINEIESTRILDIKMWERREKDREENYKSSIDKEIHIVHNDKAKKLKADWREEYKKLLRLIQALKFRNAIFVKNIEFIQFLM